MDKETKIMLVVSALSGLLFIMLVFGLALVCDYTSCKQRAEVHKSINYIYKFPAGCLVKYPWED